MGAFYRRGPNSEDCYLIMGTILQPGISEDLSFYDDMEVQIYQGFQNIDNFLQYKYHSEETLAIRDYYPW
jgi:hypothetical protein